MAKQTVSPVIRHLDKGVLALAGLVFLYTLGTFGVMSPNKVGAVGGEQFGPAEVDDQLKVQAGELVDKLQTHKPTPPPIAVVDVDQLRQDASDPLAMAGVDPRMPRPVPFHPPVPQIIGGTREKHDLVQAVQLAKPQVTFGRSGLPLVTPTPIERGKRESSSASGVALDIDWVTVSATFDFAEQGRRFLEAGYNPKQRLPAILGVDVQRREQRYDGSFTDWEDVTTLAPLLPPAAPEVDVYATNDGDVYNVSDEQKNKAIEFVDLVSSGANQSQLMRPSFPAPAYGTPWSPPDAGEYKLADMEKQCDVENRQYLLTGSSSSGSQTVVDFDEAVHRAEAALKIGNLDEAKKWALLASDKAESSSEKRQAGRLMESVETALAEAENEPATDRVPPQLLWAHDALPGSVKAGHVYQYRLRARVMNNYFGLPSLLNEPNDAAKVSLPPADWSVASDLIEIPENPVFFVKNSRPDRSEIQVDIFKWYRGSWLNKRFYVKVGDAIGEEATVRIPPEDRKEPVDFGTGSRLVDIVFDRPMHKRSKNKTELGKRESTTAAVYVDDRGRLRERLEGVDDVDPLYSDLRSQARRD